MKRGEKEEQDEYLKGIIDSSSNFLRKYPISRFTPIVIAFFETIREMRDLKFDSTFINDAEFFAENNPESEYNKNFLYRCGLVIKNKYGGLEKVKKYLCYFKRVLEELKKRKLKTNIFLVTKPLLRNENQILKIFLTYSRNGCSSFPLQVHHRAFARLFLLRH